MESSGLESAKYLLKRRRELLPLWIKIFIWLFFVFGAMVPLVWILYLIGYETGVLTIYGFGSTNPFSLLGLFISAIFLFKAAVSYGLWTEQRWAVDWAINDGIAGIILCIISMLVLPFLNSESGIHIVFRLEILVLVPYIWKMRAIGLDWAERIKG